MPIVKLSIAMNDNCDEFVCSTLDVDGKIELDVYNRSPALCELNANGFIDVVGDALNSSKLVAESLGLDIVFDESIQDAAEDLEEGLYSKMKRVYELEKWTRC